MAILLLIMAKVSKMNPLAINWIGGDVHLYENHIEQTNEQISRKPFLLPTLNITKELNNLDDIINLTIDDFELVNYESHHRIKAELSVGL